ncbi:MAG TPA: autotransporter-associated beta strand repeat-containing protein, partial [Verrucomicrobiota bacterium]|nr:autotransporter-associated beta strand repeat-containing protein [Verrucomicrobiota bacterium]
MLKPLFVGALAAICATTGQAQTTWTGLAGDGLWNTPGNWDFGVPGQFMTAFISGSGTNVNYDTPMLAPSIGGLILSNGAALNVNASGFTIDALGGAPLEMNAHLQINSGGTVLITNSGSVNMYTLSTIAVEGGTLIVTNNFGPFLMGTGESSGANNGVGITNNGGTIIFGETLEWRSRDSRFIMNGGTLEARGGVTIAENGNDVRRPFLINGGTANLGDVSISKTDGNGGLLVNAGDVTVNNFRLGTWNSRAYSRVNGGTLTVTGDFLINDRSNGATGDRRIRFFVSGGDVIATSPNGIIVVNQTGEGAGTTYDHHGALLEVTAGSLTTEKITLVRDETLTNAHARLNLAGGTIYLGSGGIVAHGIPENNSTYSLELNGGALVATAPLSIAANVTLGGGTIQTEDTNGTPADVTVTGGFLGTGSLTKTGSGRLALQGPSTHTGTLTVEEGTFALEGGTIPTTTVITIASGATFDVSFGGFALAAGQSLRGGGLVTGGFTAQAGSNIRPGDSAGTLTFGSGLTLAGGAVLEFELSDDPSGTVKANDQIVVNGDLNLSGVNTLLISALDASISEGSYTLFTYTGNLIGSVANLEVSGVSGDLVHDAVNKAIVLNTSSVRGPTDLTWVGNAVNNVWDVLGATNWLNNGALDFFIPGDDVRFDDTGGANPVVDITDIVQPASVTV